MRKLALLFALLLLATSAVAQMHRQPPGGTTIQGPMHFAVAADGSVIVLATANQLVALSSTTGNVAWTTKLTGTPMQIETHGNHFYAMVIDSADVTTMPMTRGARTIVAVSTTGTVLWSRKID